MMRKIIFLVSIVFLTRNTIAQNVGINTTGAAPDNSAMLDIDAGNKGLLIPRVALSATNVASPITSPATSLMVYNTATAGTPPNNVTPGYYYWNGTVWIRVATDGDNWKILGNLGTNPSANFLGTLDANDFQIRVNNISKIHIRNDAAGTNRVGIGTNFATVYTPSATPTLLHVHDGETGANDFALITLGSSKNIATNKLGELHFAATGVASADRRTAGVESYLTAVNTGPNVSGDLRFFTNNAGSYTEKIRVQANGRVGIGTTTPSGQLDIVQVTPNPTALFTNYGNVNEIYLQRAQGVFSAPAIIGNNGVLGRINAMGYDGTNFQNAAQIAFQVDATSGSGDMPGRITFSTTLDNTTTLTERMRINNAGNVGIGTTAPGARLHVAAAGTGNQSVIISSSLNKATFSNYDSDATTSFDISGTIGSTSRLFTIHASNANQGNDFGGRIFEVYGHNGTSHIIGLSVLNTGRVGIGTNVPGGQFELSLDQGRKPSTNTWTVVSDERLKNINGKYNKGLKEILQLRTISFHYVNNGNRVFAQQVLNTEAVGFSAQEVQKIFPECVTVDEDGYLNLNIHAIIIASINAIQEQQVIIEKQNKEIEVLKETSKQFETLKAEIEIIKSQLNYKSQIGTTK